MSRPCTCIGDTWDPSCPANLSHPKQETPYARSVATHLRDVLRGVEERVLRHTSSYMVDKPTPEDLDEYEASRHTSKAFRPGLQAYREPKPAGRLSMAMRLFRDAGTVGQAQHYLHLMFKYSQP